MQSSNTEVADVEEENADLSPPGNKEVLHALDLISRQLICQEGDLNRFISLEKEVMDNMAKNLKQPTLEKFFYLQNKCLITEIE